MIELHLCHVGHEKNRLFSWENAVDRYYNFTVELLTFSKVYSPLSFLCISSAIVPFPVPFITCCTFHLVSSHPLSFLCIDFAHCGSSITRVSQRLKISPLSPLSGYKWISHTGRPTLWFMIYNQKQNHRELSGHVISVNIKNVTPCLIKWVIKPAVIRCIEQLHTPYISLLLLWS